MNALKFLFYFLRTRRSSATADERKNQNDVEGEVEAGGAEEGSGVRERAGAGGDSRHHGQGGQARLPHQMVIVKLLLDVVFVVAGSSSLDGIFME